MLKTFLRGAAAGSAALLVCGAALAQDVTGAGASFPAPIYATLSETDTAGEYALIWSR